MKKNLIILAVLLLSVQRGFAAHNHLESEYQNAWCKQHNGITEVKNDDRTRVDCITKTHAVEFDFASKWAEGVGQALHYGLKTGKKPMVVLILENPEKEMYRFEFVKRLSEVYGFDCEFVTEKLLKQDSKGKISKN